MKMANSQEERETFLPLSRHARVRMDARRLSEEALTMAMTYGRLARVRGAEIHAIGRKEVQRYATKGINLSRYEGVQVVCSTDGIILTIYRNNDFRPLRRRGARRRTRLAA
jgi:hypothetical protein